MTATCAPDPSAAKDLIDLIVKAYRSKRRVIFFCACEYPRRCHRFEVARLLKEEARQRRLRLTTVEWPGGEPTVKRVQVQQNIIQRTIKNASQMPVAVGNLIRLVRAAESRNASVS